MKERPILFGDVVVRAILDGKKTKTRRPVKPQPQWVSEWAGRGAWLYGADEERTRDRWSLEMTEDVVRRMATEEAYGWGTGSGCPFGVPGDRLWVREAWAAVPWLAGAEKHAPEQNHDNRGVRYRATWTKCHGRWRPSIHMPRWAARLFLDITGVRVERLQDISEEGAQREGFEKREHFIRAWDGIYAPSADFDANPWVWVVSFKAAS